MVQDGSFAASGAPFPVGKVALPGVRRKRFGLGTWNDQRDGTADER